MRVTALPVLKSPFLPKPRKHNITLTLFRADLPDLAIFPLVSLCQTDDREGTENVGDDSLVALKDTAEKRDGTKIDPPASRG